MTTLVSTILTFSMTLKCNSTPQCSYNIDALSAIHYDASRAYLEGRIRLLEIAKQDIRSGVCWLRNVLRFSTPDASYLNFDHAESEPSVTSHSEYILKKSMRVCARKCVHTCAHTWSRKQNAEGSLKGWPISLRYFTIRIDFVSRSSTEF